MNKQRALDAFHQYTAAYDPSNPRIALKVAHTLRVASLCERIASSAGFDEHDVQLAWLIGLLHDIGRFEQVRLYDTFDDASSVDHATLGAYVLFEAETGDELLVRKFVRTPEHDALIAAAVALHSSYRLPVTLDERTRAFCEVLRDADKVDILKVNCTSSIEDIYRVSERDMVESEVSSECVSLFYEHRCLPRGVRHHPADVLLSHICFAWELVYPESLVIVREQGHLREMLSRTWENPRTAAAFRKMAAHMGNELAIE